ncbi:MAG: 23S rRNA (pseudouridine(1915)-N(3))-methyltransferase RlmH [Candidatus Eremiobacteraeota bacterium]|nr:23S rRNA (pseudouridine(1915)-N(3))-methyltransferase RlmH [Candidatus Eremiobacteraeota bacterium]
MQLRLIGVGKIRESYVREACEDFRKRMQPYYSLEEIEVKAADGGSPQQAMRTEAQRILKLLAPDDRVWLLDRAGLQRSSIALSRQLDEVARSGASRLTILVAGTYGADPSLVARASFLWSLSELTLLHEWARMLVLEQLYRAAKIARNEPYHH